MEQGLHAGGIVFMAAGWLFIIALNVYCFYYILKEKKEKIVGTLEVEAEIDRIDQ